MSQQPPNTRLNVNLEIDNIGIHEKLRFEKDLDSAKLAIYANNGSGKTFISKSFDLYSKISSNVSSIEQEELRNLSKRILNFDATDASFSFAIKSNSAGSTPEKLCFKLTRGNVPAVDEESKYIFHVFNTDYVKRHLEDKGYSPDSNINGVIIGAENIDVAKEENKLKELQAEQSNIRVDLEGMINDTKKQLKQLDVRANISEMRQFELESLLLKNFEQTDVEVFDIVSKTYSKLKSIPEDLKDVPDLKFSSPTNDFSEITDVLTTAHTISEFTDNFRKKIKSKEDFIIKGLDHLTGQDCPFCEQKMEQTALDLIDKYKKYHEAEESRIRNLCQKYKGKLQEINKSIDGYENDFNKITLDYNKIQDYLPSFKDRDFSPIPDRNDVNTAIEKLIDSLKTKSNSIDFSMNSKELDKTVNLINSLLTKITDHSDANNRLIQEVNKVKNDTGTEKLKIRRDLCNSKMQQIRGQSESKRTRYHALSAKIEKLKGEISAKKNKNKRDKKTEWAKTFKELLGMFFHEKYSFDEEKFLLTFSDKRLEERVDDVLSDGEKNIVAFCHFLASTHLLVETDDDYGRLFFIIDDPISSMDFHYVYKVVDCIRRLNQIIDKLGDHQRYIILTHNLEFISMLSRNQICTNTFVLRDCKIQRVDSKSALPYENHLEDIYRVSVGECEPNHTTPNSIRHLLEVLGKFMDPSRGFKKFYEDVKDFKSEPFLWNLIHDQSHGAFRNQPAFAPDDVRRSCSVVINYVKSKFPGQVESIKDRCGTDGGNT